MNGKIVALTGATGFVGKAALARLVESGCKVHALTRRAQPQQLGVSWIEGALDQPDALLRLCDGADAVLHVAGVVNARDPAEFEAGNVAGTANILAAARNIGVQRFVHISSLAAREPKLSIYGSSKAKAEKLVGTSLLDWSILRPPGVYGPGDTDVLEMFKMAQRGFCLLPPAGRSSWIHVDDLARLLVALLVKDGDLTARIFEADDGERNGWGHASFARAIGAALGKRIVTVAAPRRLMHLAAWGDELVRGGNAKLTRDRASYMCHPNWVIDRDAAPPAALWQPQIATRDGLMQTARWYKAQGWL